MAAVNAAEAHGRRRMEKRHFRTSSGSALGKLLAHNAGDDDGDGNEVRFYPGVQRGRRLYRGGDGVNWCQDSRGDLCARTVTRGEGRHTELETHDVDGRAERVLL